MREEKERKKEREREALINREREGEVGMTTAPTAFHVNGVQQTMKAAAADNADSASGDATCGKLDALVQHCPQFSLNFRAVFVAWSGVICVAFEGREDEPGFFHVTEVTLFPKEVRGNGRFHCWMFLLPNAACHYQDGQRQCWR